MLVLCLATVLVISTCNVAGQSCSYSVFERSQIGGGQEAPVTGLENCKAYCTAKPDCQGFDFYPSSGICRWHKTQWWQNGLWGSSGQHYDKMVCEVPTDVVSSPGNPQCFSTNYQGPVTDFWTASNGTAWNYQIAHFGFDWPQSGVAGIPLSPLVFIDSISFQSSDNLDYFRVVITQNNGNTITTQAIGPNDKSTSLSGANDVERVDFYLASVDFMRNVSLIDINLKVCTGTGVLRDCTLINLLRDLIVTASLGILKPGGTSGTFSASVAQEYPFVELDLNCSGYANVTFSEVIFDGAQHFQFVKINVWIGDTAVAIEQGDTFSGVQDIKFPSSVRGDRIRSTIIPSGLPDQGFNGSIGFFLYQIFVYLG